MKGSTRRKTLENRGKSHAQGLGGLFNHQKLFLWAVKTVPNKLGLFWSK